MKALNSSQPIHCLEKDKARNLIGKKVLFANHKEGLGYYGVLLGFYNKTGKFVVESKLKNRKIAYCSWVVPYGN